MREETICALSPNEQGKPQIVITRRTQNGVWKKYYARFTIPIDKRHLNKGKRYKNESLFTNKKSKAIIQAQIRYGEILATVGQERSLIGRTFKAVFDQFLEEYKINRRDGIEGYSIHMERLYRKSVSTYWVEYLEDEKIDNIVIDHFEGYEKWRKNYWKELNNDKRRRLKSNKNIRITPSQSTLAYEFTLFKSVLKWAKNNKLMTANIPEYKIRKGTRNRRLAFKELQYEQLTRFMTTNAWNKGVGRRGNDTRLIRHRAQIREWVLLMCNSGVRSGEALKLRWGDIVEHTVIDNFDIVRFMVQSSHSKVKKRREVLGLPSASVALRRLYKSRKENKYNIVNGDYCDDKDWIFCDTNGKPFKDMREGFDELIYMSGIGTDLEGNKYVPYCCRHFFISDTIRRTTLDPYIIAKNCGTSLNMLMAYYDDTSSIDHSRKLTEGLPFYLQRDKYGSSVQEKDKKVEQPFVPISKSITPDYLICLEDGKKLQMLKLYLQANYNLSPNEYRKKWGLPVDYPMVAENYAARFQMIKTEIKKDRA